MFSQQTGVQINAFTARNMYRYLFSRIIYWIYDFADVKINKEVWLDVKK